jgi:protein-tyrosine phosphatase
LDAVDGTPANPVASKNAVSRGIDLSVHRSERLEGMRLADGDLVIVFEPAQIAEVRRRLGNQPLSVLLGIWSHPNRPHIQDPYGLSDRYFQKCFSVIDANIAELVERMARGGSPATIGEPRIPHENVVHGNVCDRTLAW